MVVRGLGVLADGLDAIQYPASTVVSSSHLESILTELWVGYNGVSSLLKGYVKSSEKMKKKVLSFYKY